MSSKPITVRQLNMYVKSLIESDTKLSYITVTGEISNFKDHYSSGHWYFTLKDNNASVRCVLFKASASRVKFKPEDGMSVTVKGKVSLYEKDGQYMFYADDMFTCGEGDIAFAFKQVKEKLEAEGLFSKDSKRTLKKFPKRIAVITSSNGAAVEDIKRILARRYPVCEIIMCPVSVQGDTAVKEMTDTLDRVYELSDIDTIIIGRGGGSAEDLNAFNSETLARKIYESPVPVISAVGHETDFTICDFVADVRASTPSAAAEMAVPDIIELYSEIRSIESSFIGRLRAKYENAKLKFESYISLFSPKNLQFAVDSKQISLDKITNEISDLMKNKINRFSNDLASVITKIDALSPLKTISRGYTVVQSNERIIKSVKQITKGDRLKLTFADGYADCTVEKVAKGRKVNV